MKVYVLFDAEAAFDSFVSPIHVSRGYPILGVDYRTGRVRTDGVGVTTEYTTFNKHPTAERGYAVVNTDHATVPADRRRSPAQLDADGFDFDAEKGFR